MTSYADFHRRSIEDRDAFWTEQAALVDWQAPFQQVCDYANPPFARWFVGGTTNLCHNAVDRHLKDRADQNALIFVSTETNQERVYTYAELHAEVQRLAGLGGERDESDLHARIARFDLLGELQRRDRRAAALRFHQVWVEQIVELVIPRDDRAGQPGNEQERHHQEPDVAVD